MTTGRHRGRNHHLQPAAEPALRKAIRAGKIKRKEACERCGKSEKTHGHHEDYAKPLDVIWLCPQCHVSAHSSSYREHVRNKESALDFVAMSELRSVEETLRGHGLGKFADDVGRICNSIGRARTFRDLFCNGSIATKLKAANKAKDAEVKS